MKRRHFFTTGAGAGLAGALGFARVAGAAPAGRPAAKILDSYIEQEHRRRLENIGLCEPVIRKCLRKHIITSYQPGHCIHPVGKNWDFTEKDEQALAEYRDHGIGIVQIWSGWANCWGGDLLAAYNPVGIRKLVDAAHKYGLKVLPYTSGCFYERTDPGFKPEWAWPQSFDLVEHNYHLAHCSPASPSWRAKILPAMVRVLEEYGFDGLYNDLGYYRPGERPNFYRQRIRFAKDEVFAFEEGPQHDGAMADMLALIYEEVRRRGGVYKLHKEGWDTVFTDLRIYDYLWVGEAVTDIDYLRNRVKNYRPYVVPERSNPIQWANEDELYLNSLPYMQFPMYKGGKPEDPARVRHGYWLKQYLPMVEEGTWAWIEIGDCKLLAHPLPEDVTASVFANREIYVILANYGRTPVEIATADGYISNVEPNAAPRKIWKLEGRSFQIVRRV